MTDIIIKINYLINENTVNYIRNQIVNKNDKDILLLLNTYGGDVYCIFKCISLLNIYKMNNKKNKIKGYVKNYSYSGGTILALFCDELYMSDYAFLGPIDPQINVIDNSVRVSYLELKKLIENKSTNDEEILIQNIKMEKTTTFLESEVKKILSLHPKYNVYSEDILKIMMNPPDHHYFYSVSDLEIMNIHRDGKIPEKLEYEFKSLTDEKLEIQLFSEEKDQVNYIQKISYAIIIGGFVGLIIATFIPKSSKKI